MQTPSRRDTRVQLDGPGWPAASIRANQILRCDPPDYRPVLLISDCPARTWADPLAALDWLAQDRSQSWYGFLSYDLGRYFESLPATSIDDRSLPLFAFVAGERTDRIEPADSPAAQVVATPTVSRAAYESQIERCLDYIRAGDVFQVNLSQRFRVPLTESPATLYARLQARTPAKYAAFLDFGDFQLLSNSPELFLEQDRDRRVTTRPIKGTRPSDEMHRAGASAGSVPHLPPAHARPVPARLPTGVGLAPDQLASSAKDAAELNMIIDLERNDLGRVCEIGSVKVTQARTIETHPTVVHGVATIQGQLRRESSWVDLLRAAFPGGSITGAPKIRAMQIIDELEPQRRGPYCGAIGVIRPDGSHTFSIAIRTMVIHSNAVDVQVGGGIVADSIAADEYAETLVKARAMFEALGGFPFTREL